VGGGGTESTGTALWRPYEEEEEEEEEEKEEEEEEKRIIGNRFDLMLEGENVSTTESIYIGERLYNQRTMVSST
jgi:hypothetical protein